MAPPQLEQAVEKIDEFIAQYPSLTQYGMSFIEQLIPLTREERSVIFVLDQSSR